MCLGNRAPAAGLVRVRLLVGHVPTADEHVRSKSRSTTESNPCPCIAVWFSRRLLRTQSARSLGLGEPSHGDDGGVLLGFP